MLPQLLVGAALPLPTRYRLYFGEPMSFSGDPDDEDENIAEKVDRVKDRIADMLDEGLARRASIFW